MKLNEHVSTRLDADDKLRSASEIAIGRERSDVRVKLAKDADGDGIYNVVWNGAVLAESYSLQDAVIMACLFYRGRVDVYDDAPVFIIVKTLGDVLDEIDTILAKGDTLAGELWNILSALRGPDSGDADGDLKGIATAPIRSAAFPKTYRAAAGYYGNTGHANGAYFVSPDKFDDAVLLKEDEKLLGADRQMADYPTKRHFVSHIRSAAVALRKAGRLPESSAGDI